MDKCPFCGSVEGYYQKQRLVYNQYFDWDGFPSSADGGENYLGESKAYKYNRCISCNKVVNKFVEEPNA